jgi:hypothetical protein
MVLQHRAFKVEGDRVTEIALAACRPHSKPSHVEVRELAFGPDSDDSVRGVALWFNVDESNVVACTPAQSKRYRYKKGSSSKKDTIYGSKSSAFGSLDRFEMIRPSDTASYDLATDILKHRLAVVRTESIAAIRDRHDEVVIRNKEKELLKERFTALKRHWTAWGWPVNDGREKVSRNTTVPKVDGMYEFPRVPGHILAFEYDEDDFRLGRNSRKVWLSFVNQGFEGDVSRSSLLLIPFCRKIAHLWIFPFTSSTGVSYQTHGHVEPVWTSSSSLRAPRFRPGTRRGQNPPTYFRPRRVQGAFVSQKERGHRTMLEGHSAQVRRKDRV